MQTQTPTITSSTPTIQRKGIEETRQLLRAVLRVGVKAKKATQDGKLRFAEYAGFLTDTGIIIDGLRGIGEVPSEMLDLTMGETQELHAEAMAILAEMGVTSRQEEIIQRAFIFLQAGINLLSFIVLAPPSAEAA